MKSVAHIEVPFLSGSKNILGTSNRITTSPMLARQYTFFLQIGAYFKLETKRKDTLYKAAAVVNFDN